MGAVARLQAAVTSDRAESLLRGACAAASAASALLLGLSAQTKTVLFVRKKAVPKDVEALWVLIVAAAVAAGYHAARLLKRLCSGGRFAGGEDGRGCARAVAWACFLLDKGCAYVVFASAVAALQACFVALTGVEPLQWSRLCNIYTRFCVQGAFGMVCGLAAAVGMALLSVFSARDLFRLYSPAGRRQARLRSESSQTGLISKNEMTRGSAGDD
ncbi:CASP-like protein 2C4 [Aegilops tauschii subsp. strangulata]|uniref:CASP-like protein n=1 Tax=Aegilops tauschii subsp. strangulata TaxID=200361 RepID=A0A453NJ05_AEGTS|nr:CASP-like protein 2C4 [Aegilops tauschii subsp. strangulata]